MIKENPVYNLHRINKQHIIKGNNNIKYNLHIIKGNNNIKYEIHIKYTIK